MNHTLLKQIIMDQHAIIRDFRITARDYAFEPDADYILTGLRRAGKSTILYGIVRNLIAAGTDWNQIVYINFEDERLSDFTWKDFNDIVETASELSSEKTYYFFDEIQNIDRWESFARRMADAKEKVWITGSNARMLSSEMESKLGGRYLSREIMPYDFEEYLTAKNIPHSENDLIATKSAGLIRAAADSFWREGGFPESVSYLDKRSYAENVYQKVLLGDIAARNGIRQVEGLRILMKKTAETVCRPVSYTKLYNTLHSIGIHLSKDTVITYIHYAEDAFLLFDLKNYYSKFNERESNPKFYFYDNALLNLFLFNKDSALLENEVAVSLRRRYRKNVWYLQSSRTGIDIDFYVPEKQLAIQVAASISDPDTRRRETGNLIKLSQNSDDIRKFIIVTFEEEETIYEKNTEISVIPLYKFLLGYGLDK